MLGYNGSVPGPVLHVDQGSEITVQVRNDGDVEATVHWHGLRLETVTTGSRTRPRRRSRSAGPSPTSSSSPMPGSTGTTRTSAKTTAWRWGYTHDRGRARRPGILAAVDRQLTLTLDDLLVEDGQIAPFRRSGPTFVAMGRYGNVMLINGETQFSGQARRARSCACMSSTPRTPGSSTSPSAAPAPSWSAVTAAATNTRRSPTRCCLRLRACGHGRAVRHPRSGNARTPHPRPHLRPRRLHRHPRRSQRRRQVYRSCADDRRGMTIGDIERPPGSPASTP